MNDRIPRLPEAAAVAERFHERHEFLHRKDADPFAWRDMPEAYRHRLVTVFDTLIREGSIQPGAGLKFHRSDPEQL